MADNVTFQTVALATAPDATVVATDDVGGAQYQRVKIDVGGDGVSAPVTAASPLPVSAASLPLPTGAATAALQTQPGVDIGDVTVNNAAGAAAVNVQDGGNSLTVDYATTGSGTATGALRVELPTNGTGVVGLNAGAALIGKVGIDQTTPGTTNAVAPISGQAGVAGNTGVVTALTQRVVLATDVGLPAGTALLGKTGIDQTTSGTTNLVALISGQNGIVGNTGVVGATTPRVTLATDVQLPKSNILESYVASANLTVTNLNSLAASATYIAGWQSAIIDNSSNKYPDYRITAQLTGASSNNQAGFAFMFLVGLLDDSTWPAGFGTGEGTVTPTGGISIINAICRSAAAIAIDNSAGRIYYMDCPSVAQVFGGVCPSKFVIFITGNATTTTTAQFASSGNQVTYKAVNLTLGA